jgi:uncharacterized phiE125 gp8 family phage protein
VKIVTSTHPLPPVVGVPEAREHLRIDHNDDNAVIQGYLEAATWHVENFTGQVFSNRVVTLSLDAWPDGDAIKLPIYPVQSITSIKYYDTDGNDTTWNSDNYIADVARIPPLVALAYGCSWPTETLLPVSGIQIDLVAGYASPDYYPPQAKQVVKLLTGQWYEHREDLQATYLKGLPQGIEALLWGIRVTW